MAVKVTKDYISTPNLIDIREYNTLSEAVIAIGSAEKTLVIAESFNVNEDVTVPENIKLKFENGGKFIVGDTFTLTLNCPIEAWLYHIFDGDGTVTGSPKIDAVYPQWFGAKGDGVNDDTDAMIKAHSFGLLVRYIDGSYIFKGETLDLTGGIDKTGNVVFTNNRYNGIIAFDRDGNLIGLHHNHLEVKINQDGSVDKITSGNIIEPPEAKPLTANVDVMAFWYNDFGLEYQRVVATGWNGWYTWEWNHTDAVQDLGATTRKLGYLPNRHPLLGWYRGDDKNVLDWTCYWLVNSGVRAVIPQCTVLNDTWTSETDPHYWIYQLLQTKNSKYLSVIPWVTYTGDYTSLYNGWTKNISQIHNYNRAYTMLWNGKKYFTVYIYEGTILRGSLDNYVGSTNTKAFLADISNYCKTLGYDGVAVLARHSIPGSLMSRGELVLSDVLYIETSYACSDANIISESATYGEAVDNYTPEHNPIFIPTIYTELLSSNHPSNYYQTGSTPDLFKKLVKKTVDFVRSNPNCPNAICVYNVSEWGEGGAGLIPTLGSGYGYLDAIREALSSANNNEVSVRYFSRNWKPTTSLKPDPIIGISFDYSVTLTTIPHIEDGLYEGQEIIIYNYDALNAGYGVILKDERVLSGTNVYFKGATNKTLSAHQCVKLVWVNGKWIEI